MSTWYENLKKPPMTPPNQVFWPVWATLYVLIFISLITWFLTPEKVLFFPTVLLLTVHFTAGFCWTTLFFGKRKILLALLDILLMDVTLSAIIVIFLKTTMLSGLLLIPYFCWALFATYLNFGILRLNPEQRSPKP